MKKSVSQAIMIILLALGIGMLGNQVSPRGLTLIAPPKPIQKPEIFMDLSQAKQFWDMGSAIFLDARDPADYEAGHIGNALNLPAQSFAPHFGEVAPILTPESVLILYCDGEECELSHRLRDHLNQLGYTNTHLLHNGWTTWHQAGFPTTSGGQQ